MYFKHLVFVISILSFVHSAPSCGENEVYTNCMSPCKLQQCEHLKQMPDCDPNIKCQPGCECIQNFLRNSDNVCISSEICEEYDSKFDPETDIDVILNESDDGEATNEDQVFDNTVSSQDGLTKDTEPGSKMISNTEDAANTDHYTEDDDQAINGIEDYLSFEEQIKNGDWVIEQTEHNNTNQEPNTDQQKVDNKESEMDTERSTEKQNVQAPENEVEPATEKKLKPEETESNRTELNQNNIDDKIGNKKSDHNVDKTLETSTMPEKNKPPKPEHVDQPNNKRPEQNTDESRQSTNMPENNEWPNRRPGTEVNPEDREDTNQWPEPPRPWHGEQPYTTSRPEQSTKPWYPYIPKQIWNGSKHHKRPICGNNHETIILPTYIFVKGKSNERHTRPKNRHDRKRGHKYERNREPERRRGNEHTYNREPERRRENEYGHDRSSHRRPRTWCRRHPGDKRRPCPRYNRPKHDSHKNYKNNEQNNNHDRSNKRPTRVCMSQHHGKPICYVRKSYKRDSRRN